MEVFNYYAEYYDLLYTTKNYEAESNYVNDLIKTFSPEATTILDLGCGTGSHDFHLARQGYSITGVDLSEKMIFAANSKKINNREIKIDFLTGNIVTIDLKKEFDVVISLFHVIDYLTTNLSLTEGIKNVSKHLKKNGIFIFDFWYGPAVLTELPKVGVKRLSNDLINVTRIVEPTLFPNENVVDVNYEIIIEEKINKTDKTIKECHSVRYFFKPELEMILNKYGMEIIQDSEWLSGNVLSLNTFGACIVARKV